MDEMILLNTTEVAALLRISPATLEKARSTGMGDYPPFIHIGRHVRYRMTDFNEWLNRRERKHFAFDAAM